MDSGRHKKSPVEIAIYAVWWVGLSAFMAGVFYGIAALIVRLWRLVP